MKQIVLVTTLLFNCYLSHAQTDASWVWGKADAADIIAGNPAVNQQIAAASSGGNVLWAMLQNQALNYSSFYFGSYKLTQYDSTGAAGTSATISGKLYLQSAQSDAAGNWYVLGQYYDTLSFPGGPVFINPTPSSSTPYFIFKLNSGSMTVAWVKIIGTDNSNTVNTFTITNTGLYMAIDSEYTYISKYDLNTGDRTDLFIQPFRSYTSSIAVDGAENIYLAGSCAFSGIDFNGHVVSTSISYPVYIVKYTPDGTYRWHHLLADVICTERKLTIANDNSIYYSGRVNDTFSFGGFPLHHPAWVYDYLVSRMDSTGNVLWVKQQKDSLGGDANLEHVEHAVVLADGSLSVLATLRGYIDWGGGLTTGYGINDNVAVVNYSPAGAVNWVKYVNALQTDARSIASNGKDIWVSGQAYDSSAYTIGGITVPVAPLAETPFLAMLRTGNASNTQVQEMPGTIAAQVTPIPATNTLTIKVPANTTGDVHIRLTDVSGRLILDKTENSNSATYQLDVSPYSRGLYFIDISGLHFRTIRKIVLQ